MLREKVKMSKNEAIRSLQTEVTRLRQENDDLKGDLTLLRSSVKALRELQDLIKDPPAEFDVLQWIEEILASALLAVGSKDGSLLLLDEESDELVFAVVHGNAQQHLLGHRMRLGEGIAGWVAENRLPQIVKDARGDPRFNPLVDEMLGFHTRTLACVPLVDGDRVLGVIEAINKLSDGEFTLHDQDLLILVAHFAAFGIKHAESIVE
jgi:sigma-B regulation protein RsbU (phosphoserine phosphatase)